MSTINLKEYVIEHTKEDDVMRKFVDPKFRIGVRLRTDPITKLVLHWTGGDNSAMTVFRTLSSRNLSVHYVIDRQGDVWSCHDPKTWVTSHAGYVNDASIGIEIVSPGTSVHSASSREIVRDNVHGRKCAYYGFFDVQMTALHGVIMDILRRFPTISRNVPTDENGKTISTVMDQQDVRNFSGILGHLHVSATKTDPGVKIFDVIRSWIGG